MVPKYLDKRPPSAMKVILHAEDLASYIYRIAKTMEKMVDGKIIADDLRKEVLKLNKHLQYVTSLSVIKKNFKRLHKYQRKVEACISNIESLLNLSVRLAKLNNPTYVIQAYCSLLTSYNVWVKNIRRQEKKVVAIREADKNAKVIANINNGSIDDTMPKRHIERYARDDEGFYLLVRKQPAVTTTIITATTDDGMPPF